MSGTSMNRTGPARTRTRESSKPVTAISPYTMQCQYATQPVAFFRTVIGVQGRLISCENLSSLERLRLKMFGSRLQTIEPHPFSSCRLKSFDSPACSFHAAEKVLSCLPSSLLGTSRLF